MNTPRGQVLVLYGIAGDLAKKMIIPALYRLTARGALDVQVIGVDRGPLDAATLARTRADQRHHRLRIGR
jgi:glucose-6-phosphate 1-dehydrogenase